MEKINKTVGSFVTENYRTASIFDKYGIDFCCRGNRSLDEACNEHSVDKQALLNELANLSAEKASDDNDPAHWPLDLLADYIEKKHHRYVEKAIPELFAYLEKVVNAHGSKHPEVIEIAEHFKISAGELTKHMKKEELVLFPYIKKMVEAQDHGKPLPSAMFGNVQNPIAMMMNEHENEGERFRLIANLSNNYEVPADACNTFRVNYSLLKAFQDDLHRHIHLENNILFPKAIEMESSFSQ
ncbi:MAG: iron-sulfur cluster repair di-iron protein [Lentimicrobium sp.]|nr:iron-sulfur cluster repair di-iron protein [Lentimicrobium sp.]